MVVPVHYFTDPGCPESWGNEPTVRRLAVEIEMPMDPLFWRESPISSTYPACIAVKAAAEQGIDAQGVPRGRLMCFRRKLDSLEPFAEEARRTRLDVERFRVDAGSHAMLDAFSADLAGSSSASRPGGRPSCPGSASRR